MILLTIFLAVIVVFWLLKRLLPLMLLALLSRAAKRGGTFYTNVPPTGGAGFGGARSEKGSAKAEGEITIEVTPEAEAHKGVSKTIGEYVDYQEEK